MHNYKLTIAYDGTDFCGWQQQHTDTSIQETIKKALETLLRHPLRLIGSGRTDAGVHALGQVAHFHTPETLSESRFLHSINALLPPTIRILQIESVPVSFHAQYSALGKIYHYHLCLDPIVLPMKRLYSWKPFLPLNLSHLEKAASFFIGTHDFTTFTNRGSDTSDDPIRTIHRLSLVPEEGGLRLEFEGNGFLYKMVRNITGTLVAAASNRLELATIPLLLASRDRRLAPQGAPAKGLFLAQVLY